MPTCSTTKIVVGGVTLLNFDDIMEAEVSTSTSQEIQVNPKVRATAAQVSGRQNYVTTVNWSRYYFFDPDTAGLGQPEDAIDAARIFAAFHGIPGGTFPSATGDIGDDFPTQSITVPEGTNTATFTYNYGYGTIPHAVAYSSAALTDVSIEIPQPTRVLVRYSMTMSGGSIV